LTDILIEAFSVEPDCGVSLKIWPLRARHYTDKTAQKMRIEQENKLNTRSGEKIQAYELL
jgi:hypothetical protein